MRCWMLFVAGLTWITTANAIEPEGLPTGTWLDVLECLDADEGTACEAAAAAIDDPAWAALLRGRGGDSLDGDDRRLFRALSCADGDARACTSLALSDLASERPTLRYRGAGEAVRGCALGDAPACRLAGLAEPGAAAWTALTEGSMSTGTIYKDLKDAAKTCGKSKTPGTDCTELARIVFSSADDADALLAAASAARALCASDDQSAACALANDLSEPTGPYDIAFAPSLRLAEHLCVDDDNGRACKIASGLASLGRTVPFTSLASLSYEQLACNAGVKSGCERVTDALRSERLPTFTRRCDDAEGDPRSCTFQSIATQFGVGVPKDGPLARLLQDTACERGDPSACLWTADKLWDDDELAAYGWYRKACDAGSGLACGIVGRMEVNGESGVPKDTAAGIAHLRRGEALGAPYPMLVLGQLYIEGNGVSADNPAAAALFGRSCAMGNLEACGSIAVMELFEYETSLSMPDAQQVAIATCNRGEYFACSYLATVWSEEDGPLPKDIPRARWAARVACAGDPDDEEDDNEQACDLLDSLGAGPEQVESSRDMPHLRLGGSWYPPSAWSDGADPLPPVKVVKGPRERPDRPSPRPLRLTGSTGPWLVGSAGSQRSWTLDNQAGGLRFSFGVPLSRFLIGADIDFVSDSRFHPKTVRSYWRTMGYINVGLSLPFTSFLIFELGGGPALGGFRPGPDDIQPIALSYGAHELLQLRVQLSKATAGIRVEQQQLWNQGNPEIDHITGLYGFVGVAFE